MKKITLSLSALSVLIFYSCGKKSQEIKEPAGKFCYHLDTSYKENSLEISEVERTFYFKGGDFSYSLLSQKIGDSNFDFEMGNFSREMVRENDIIDTIPPGNKIWKRDYGSVSLNDSSFLKLCSMIETCINNPEKDLHFYVGEIISKIEVTPIGFLGDVAKERHKGSALVRIGGAMVFFDIEEIKNMKSCYQRYKKEK